MTSPLFSHQLEAINRLLPVLQQTGGAYVAHEVGCGKTLTSIAVARLLKAERILVVTNVPGLGVWPREVEKWWPDAHHFIYRTDKPLAPGIPGIPSVAITNYQQLIGDTGKKKVERLRKWKPDLLILDESHKAKSPSAKTTRACWKLADAARYRVLLSGTPAHTPLDWWAQFRMVAPHEPMWAQKYREYKEQVAVLDGPMRMWVTGFRPTGKEDALRAMVPYVHVATADQLHLPEPIHTVVPHGLSQAEWDAYSQMASELAVDFEDGAQATAAIVLTKTLRLHQLAAGHVTTETGETRRVGRSKLDVLAELLEERQHQKVIVACQFRKDIDDIKHELVAAGRPVLVIDGRTSSDERELRVRWFQEEDKPYVLILQYQAGGSALTLTAAKALIFYTMNYSSIDYRQMLGRVFRPGQTAHVQYLYLLAEGTVDEPLLDGLREDMDQTNLARHLATTVKEGRHAHV